MTEAMDDGCNTGSQPKLFSFRNIRNLMINSFHRLRNRLQRFIEAIFAAIAWAIFFLAIFATLFGSYEQEAMLIVFMIIVVDWVRSISHYDYMAYFSWLTTLSAKCCTKCKELKEEASESVWMPVANEFRDLKQDFKAILLRESALFRELLATSNYTYIHLTANAIGFFVSVLLLIFLRLLLAILAFVFLSRFLIFMVIKIACYLGAPLFLILLSTTAFRWVRNYCVEYLTLGGIGSGVLIFCALLLASCSRNRLSGTFYSEIDEKQCAIRSSTASNTDRYRRDSQRGRDSTSGNKTQYDYSKRRTTNGESSLRNRGKATTTEEREPGSDNSNEGQ